MWGRVGTQLTGQRGLRLISGPRSESGCLSPVRIRGSSQVLGDSTLTCPEFLFFPSGLPSYMQCAPHLSLLCLRDRQNHPSGPSASVPNTLSSLFSQEKALYPLLPQAHGLCLSVFCHLNIFPHSSGSPKPTAHPGNEQRAQSQERLKASAGFWFSSCVSRSFLGLPGIHDIEGALKSFPSLLEDPS